MGVHVCGIIIYACMHDVSSTSLSLLLANDDSVWGLVGRSALVGCLASNPTHTFATNTCSLIMIKRFYARAWSAQALTHKCYVFGSLRSKTARSQHAPGSRQQTQNTNTHTQKFLFVHVNTGTNERQSHPSHVWDTYYIRFTLTRRQKPCQHERVQTPTTHTYTRHHRGHNRLRLAVEDIRYMCVTYNRAWMRALAGCWYIASGSVPFRWAQLNGNKCARCALVAYAIELCCGRNAMRRSVPVLYT